jgi:hypothetical protein
MSVGRQSRRPPPRISPESRVNGARTIFVPVLVHSVAQERFKAGASPVPFPHRS